MIENRAFRLRRRPQGHATDADLEFVTEPVPELEDGQALDHAERFEEIIGKLAGQLMGGSLKAEETTARASSTRSRRSTASSKAATPASSSSP